MVVLRVWGIDECRCKWKYLVWSNMQQQRSGSKYVVGRREGWKSMVVNKMMYGCGALAWNQHECDDLEGRQNGMGRWLWGCGKC